MSVELTLDSLQEMKVADYVKAFKNKAVWKKAKHVILLQDFKLDGKKVTVALPFKKPNEAKQAFKRIKKENLHVLKKVGVAEMKLDKGENGSPLANLQFYEGGLKAETVAKKAEKLFSKIKLALDFGLSGDQPAQEETAAPASPTTATTEASTQEDSPKSDAAAIVEQLKAGFTQLKDQFNQFKGNVVPKVKTQSVEQQDLDFIQSLLDGIQSYGQEVQQAPAQLKSKFEKALGKLQAQAPILQKVLNKFGNAVEQGAESTVQQSKKRLEEIKARIAEIQAELAA